MRIIINIREEPDQEYQHHQCSITALRSAPPIALLIYLSDDIHYNIVTCYIIVRRPAIQHEHNDCVSAMTNIKYKHNVSTRESFNVLKKGAPSDLSIYFLKENMIYSLRCAGTKYGNREDEKR